VGTLESGWASLLYTQEGKGRLTMDKRSVLFALLAGVVLAACLPQPAIDPMPPPTPNPAPTITPILTASPAPTATLDDAAWGERFSAIEPGASREAVESQLGPPDARQELTLPSEPFFGPGEGLAAILEPGAPYEEWIYRRAEIDYYVWFSAPPGDPAGAWGVVLAASYPADAVF
jgi:hypothetical protein